MQPEMPSWSGRETFTMMVQNSSQEIDCRYWKDSCISNTTVNNVWVVLRGSILYDTSLHNTWSVKNRQFWELPSLSGPDIYPQVDNPHSVESELSIIASNSSEEEDEKAIRMKVLSTEAYRSMYNNHQYSRHWIISSLPIHWMQSPLQLIVCVGRPMKGNLRVAVAWLHHERGNTFYRSAPQMHCASSE